MTIWAQKHFAYARNIRYVVTLLKFTLSSVVAQVIFLTRGKCFCQVLQWQTIYVGSSVTEHRTGIDYRIGLYNKKPSCR